MKTVCITMNDGNWIARFEETGKAPVTMKKFLPELDLDNIEIGLMNEVGQLTTQGWNVKWDYNGKKGKLGAETTKVEETHTGKWVTSMLPVGANRMTPIELRRAVEEILLERNRKAVEARKTYCKNKNK